MLRLLATAAYHPALIYVDTLKYLYGASPGSEPLGYTAVLRAILLAGGLGVVALVQHLLGLAMAAALYAVLLRRGLARWLAALAVAPVLLDAYQVQMEQMIMPDVWFEALIVAGLAVLLWRPAVTVRVAAAAGLVLGTSAAVKQLGELLIVPAVLYVVAAGGYRAVRAAAALSMAFALPVLACCGFSYARNGHFRLAHRQSVTGRLVAAADCATLKLPAAVRPLCPAPAAQANGPDWLEHSGKSPLYQAAVTPGTRGALIGALDSAIAHQQPLRVAVSIAQDSLRLFAPVRGPSRWVAPISRWQFQTSYPAYPPWVSLRPGNAIVVGVQHVAFGRFNFSVLRPSYGGPARVDRPVAAFLRSYQLDGGYTPGPLLALLSLAALAGSLLALSRRRPAVPAGPAGPAALACLLFTATAVTVLLAPDVFEFSWRYELPAVITLAPAGVLGAAVLVTAVRGGAVLAGRRSVLRRGDRQAGVSEDLAGGPGARPDPGGDAAQQ
ncbi:MAG TPA: hypothetical protein VMV17_05775 [Streptosporangiaceae bacterium]|nr:hypothetical protein [Streptosporangiaceae bacterium]